MINSFKILLLFPFFLIGIVGFTPQNNGETKHIVKIYHPGIDTEKEIEKTLIQVKNTTNNTVEYYMNVETVVCGDSRCRIDVVKIVWDELGFYKRLDIPENVELEKAEGEHFDAIDYQKLNQILANRQSSLKDVFKYEVVGNETTEGVDGMTGATIILNTSDYVKGAVWTCYTLWHFTNGNIFPIIRDISATDLTNENLQNYLKKDNTKYKIFALEQMIKRQDYTPETINLVLNQAQFDDYSIQKLMINYFENASTDVFTAAMLELLKTKNDRQRQLFLTALKNTKHNLSNTFINTISNDISKWNDYRSFHLFFNILENQETVNTSVIQQVMPRLKHQNFLIARRTYWFLETQILTKKQEKLVQDFYKKYKARL